ncbi:unnamed protein product [Auanema sp. JU1783]|nr:unnamed protein product [Auanema sp. JU1783]
MMEVNDSSHHADDSNIVVEEMYEEDVDADMGGLLPNNDTVLQYDEDEERNDGDEYGGMPIELYNSIVAFKRSGLYPPTLNSRQDRSAASHWRSRCMRFILAEDSETLLYYNPTSSVNDQAKVVVKKGEVRRVLERIHELIGHLGQKRTQMVVLKKLHWRSVRQDVKTFIMNCSFCNQKKLEGKKILKAPVDISSEHFGLNIEVRNKAPGDGSGQDRLSFSLIGYNEHEVQAAAMSRMTTYTFKETAPDLRGGRYTRLPKSEYAYVSSMSFPNFNSDSMPGNSLSFRRQPYIKRSRCGSYPTSYILPYAPKGNREETEFIVFPDPRNSNSYTGEDEEFTKYEEIEDSRSSSQIGRKFLAVDHEETTGHPPEPSSSSPINPPVQIKAESSMLSNIPVYYDPPKRPIPASRSNPRRRRNKFNHGPTGAAARFSLAVGDGDRMDLGEHTAELLTPLDAAQSRPELIGLAPIMLMPSVDPEVVHLQKELLTRQLNIQALQEKILHSQYESMRIPIARYEEIDPRGDRIQLLSHVGQNVIESIPREKNNYSPLFLKFPLYSSAIS